MGLPIPTCCACRVTVGMQVDIPLPFLVREASGHISSCGGGHCPSHTTEKSRSQRSAGHCALSSLWLWRSWAGMGHTGAGRPASAEVLSIGSSSAEGWPPTAPRWEGQTCNRNSFSFLQG